MMDSCAGAPGTVTCDSTHGDTPHGSLTAISNNAEQQSVHRNIKNSLKVTVHAIGCDKAAIKLLGERFHAKERAGCARNYDDCDEQRRLRTDGMSPP